MALTEVDTKVAKRGGVGASLLKTGAAIASGGLSAGLDAATGGVVGNLGAIGRKLGDVFEKSPTGSSAMGAPSGSTALSRRYYAMP